MIADKRHYVKTYVILPGLLAQPQARVRLSISG